MVKVVVAGGQYVGSRNQAAWSQQKEAEVVGMADSVAALRELLKEKEVDVVDIGPTLESPEEWIVPAAEAKKHVICDFGGQIGVEAIREVATLCENQGVQLLLANALRFSPEYEQAREHVQQGAIGKPGVIRMRRSGPAPALGAGKPCIFNDLGAEEFDWLHWTFGNVVRVMARRVTHTDEFGQQMEYALVILRHEDGTIAHVELSWAEEDERAAFELTGDLGMIWHDSSESQPIVLQMSKQQEQADSGAERFTDVADADRWRRSREHFLRSLSGQEPLRLSLEDVIYAREIVQAARQSAETGQPVQLVDGGNSR
ncbi:Gfo/Idh/MocA family protein [Brevibacillus sp. NRS-1366]|uniref:Gfo/Idh/MocA family protein n=1 Tax=Brevibacillus sp. NRS-1366 TaxID=3233899 RepID=UPI003D219583